MEGPTMIPATHSFPSPGHRPTFVRGVTATVATALLAASPVLIPASAGADDVPVQVIVDMDRDAPGFQSDVRVPAGHVVTVRDIAVWVIDPLGNRPLHSIGYLGGIDRGLAFGHNPADENQGQVASLEARAVTPVNPASTGFIDRPP